MVRRGKKPPTKPPAPPRPPRVAVLEEHARRLLAAVYSWGPNPRQPERWVEATDEVYRMRKRLEELEPECGGLRAALRRIEEHANGLAVENETLRRAVRVGRDAIELQAKFLAVARDYPPPSRPPRVDRVSGRDHYAPGSAPPPDPPAAMRRRS
jgi:hypothetical protein